MVGTFVLAGAGLSKAVSKEMPLLRELAADVVRRLGLHLTVLAPFAGDLEQWMSFLSVDQPWLLAEDNLRNRALFQEASYAVWESIREAEARAVCNPPQIWLARLVMEWCHVSADIATFNYDLLLERSLSELSMASTWSDVYGISLTKRQAPGNNPFLSQKSPPNTVPTLYKLHGSINWAFGGLEAPPSDRVVLREDGLDWSGALTGPQAVKGRELALYDDVSPLIIPPTGTKGPFYGNRSLRGQWGRAYRALKAADQVVILGYSFPPSDLVSRHFLASADVECPITVVDYSDRVAPVVASLAPRACVSTYLGQFALRDFVEAACGDIIKYGIVDTPDGACPTLRINDIDQSLHDCSGFDAVMERQDRPEVDRWITDLADRRWPGIHECRPTDYYPKNRDGESLFWAYSRWLN